MKKYQFLLSGNFQFLVVKFSIYLNRRVFVMSLLYPIEPDNIAADFTTQDLTLDYQTPQVIISISDYMCDIYRLGCRQSWSFVV